MQVSAVAVGSVALLLLAVNERFSTADITNESERESVLQSQRYFLCFI